MNIYFSYFLYKMLLINKIGLKRQLILTNIESVMCEKWTKNTGMKKCSEGF